MSLGPHATESVFGLTATSFRRLACVTGSRLEKHRSLTPLPSLSFHHSLLVPPDMPFLLSSARCEPVCRVTLGPLDGRGPAASSSAPSPFPTAASGMSTCNSRGRESPAPENRDRQDLPSPAPGIPKLSKAQIPANRPPCRWAADSHLCGVSRSFQQPPSSLGVTQQRAQPLSLVFHFRVTQAAEDFPKVPGSAGDGSLCPKQQEPQ